MMYSYFLFKDGNYIYLGTSEKYDECMFHNYHDLFSKTMNGFRIDVYRLLYHNEVERFISVRNWDTNHITMEYPSNLMDYIN